MITLLVLAQSLALATAASAQIDPPTVRQSKNGEFLSKYYPYAALQRGEQGRVGFELTVDRQGMLTSCVVTESSGHANLDRETCEFLVKYAKLKPVRDAEGRTATAVQQGFINWQLPKGAKALAAVDSRKALDPEKLICRKYPRTGSKASFVKTCLTRKEWSIREQSARESFDSIQNSVGCGGGELTPPRPCG